MSVILYEDEKFYSIYESLRLKGRDLGWLFGYPEGWQELGGLDSHVRAFAEDLRRGNILTWNRQYEDAQEPLRVLDWDDFCELAALNNVAYANDYELLKSLRGLRYNLIDNGGGETDFNGAYKRLNDLIEYVAFEIIDRMSEWQKANTW